MEENYKNHVQNKLNCIYSIITDTPSENKESCIAYNSLSSDEDVPVSTEPNQSTNVNDNIANYYKEVDGYECDISNADVENQMDVPMQEIVDDDGELLYEYM